MRNGRKVGLGTTVSGRIRTLLQRAGVPETLAVGDPDGSAKRVNCRSRRGTQQCAPSVLLNHDLAEVGKIIHDLVPFRYGEMAGYQPVHQFLAQHQGEKGAEDVAADGRIGSMKIGLVASSVLAARKPCSTASKFR